MTQTPAQQQENRLAGAGYRSVPREFVDPPSAWNPTVGLFFGGYALAALTGLGLVFRGLAVARIAVYWVFGTASRRHGDPRCLSQRCPSETLD
jgi:hypothetical protein